MQKATQTPLPALLEVTVRVINRLLANRPKGLDRAGFVGNESKNITGYAGVRVFFYTEPGARKDAVTVNLQVSGPEPLVAAVVERYKGRYTAWGRTEGHAVFHVTD